MQHDRKDLEALFAPASGEYGTHMLICGLSADTETLERIVSAFTCEAKVQRAATGLLKGVLMLDASAPLLGPLVVPGLLQLAPCSPGLWTEKTSLMHAKVALMGFAPSKFSAPTSLRLVVSTGNWTRETWGNGSQIDLFWSTTWKINEPGEPAAKARADIRSALDFFGRIMAGLYAPSYQFILEQDLAMSWLERWKEMVAALPSNRRPRFIHSLDQSLFKQIKTRFPKTGISTVVAGSGFFEQSAADPAGQPDVLAKLEELGSPGTRYLVFNIKQAGALAGWIAANRKKVKNGKLGNWTFCMPTDPLQSKAGLGRSRLHAKYIAGLKRIFHSRNQTGTLGALYLGSGNLSRSGFLTCARLESEAGRCGNVEAGIFMDEESVIPQVWQALACGEIQSPENIEEIEPGAGEPMFDPRPPPPVLFARVVAGRLELIRSSDLPVALQLRTSSVTNWIDVGAQQSEIDFPCEVASPIVWVRLPVTTHENAGTIHEIPVFSQDGLLCRQSPPQVSVDDLLEALLVFPEVPPYLADPDSPGNNGGHGHASRPSVSATRYPLRLIASLIEAIAQRNSILTKEQFPVWLSQLRVLLLEQISEADQAAIRTVGINLFPSLTCSGFKPTWLEEVPTLKSAYESLLADVQKAWCTPDAACAVPAVENRANGSLHEEKV